MEEMHDNNGVVPNNDGTRPGRNGGTLMPAWQKGQSGNPEGMKKGTMHLTTIMRRLLDEDMVVTINGKPFVMTRAQALMLEKIRLATSSEHDAVRLRAIMDIEDRIEGKPIPIIPEPPENDDDGVVFYIPNQHSRKRVQP